MLKLDADGVKQLMRDQARNNEQILQTIHTHDTEIDNLESNMATAFTNLKITSGWLINSVAVMTAFSQTMAVGRKIESTIETAERILAKSDQGLLDRASISESSLSRKIDQIYLKRNANTPVLSGEGIQFYYKLDLAHSWVEPETFSIKTLLQIPIAPMTEVNTLVVLDPLNRIHADLPLAVVNKAGNFYRYLTTSDYHKCVTVGTNKICQKRRIEISPHHGCGIRLNNCDIWATTVAHDISNTEIMVLLPNSSNATVKCDDGSVSQLRLPIRSIITLNLHCELKCDTFMIRKVSFRHMGQAITNLTMNQKITILKSRELIASQLNINLQKIEPKHKQKLTNLMRNNVHLIDHIKQQIETTASIWATSKGGRSGWEQLIIWAIVAIAVLTACLAIFVSVRVLCKVKRIKTRVREAEINGKSVSADLKSRVIDVETDIENMRSKR